ncbi:hypothetical protein BGZ99_004443 [Dissophora globulifera]|uniref:Uncharacterized protein n=1 Tax=Dissophora globulifera TaxID=979702 RepID=A0A9P6RJQ6_9FUNG|nr:hypothetical protein BGZ99_004443 [Dissophora globulifera]
MQRTMTLRNGKVVMKERAQAMTSVDGALKAMIIAREESLQVAAEVDVMAIDDEDVRSTPPIDLQQVSIADARDHLQAAHGRHHQAVRRKLAILQRNSRAVDGGTIAQKQQFVDICSEVQYTKEKVEIWKSLISSRESTDDTLQDAASKNARAPPEQESAPKKQKYKELKLSPDFPRYHPKVEAHLMPKLEKGSGRIRTNVSEFLCEFKWWGEMKYEIEYFNTICYQLLSMANLDRQTAKAFRLVFINDLDGVWDWERCEQAFVNSALTPDQKAQEVADYVRSGREQTESFVQFHRRLVRHLQVYRVHDMPRYAGVPEMLKTSFPSLVMTVMKQGALIDKLMKRLDMPVPDTSSLEFIMDSIPFVDGPEECRDWESSKDFIERKYGSDYGKTRDPPGAQSLPKRRRRKSKARKPRSNVQELPSAQRQGTDRTENLPKNDAGVDVQKRGSRKRRRRRPKQVDASTAEATCKRKRGTDVGPEKSNEEKRITRAHKRGRH